MSLSRSVFQLKTRGPDEFQREREEMNKKKGRNEREGEELNQSDIMPR